MPQPFLNLFDLESFFKKPIFGLVLHRVSLVMDTMNSFTLMHYGFIAIDKVRVGGPVCRETP